jgi:hypothetical protein
MNTSFTPGPWVMTEEGEDDLVVCSERGDFICAPSGATFGEVIDNARLIAAAPAMFIALQEMLCMFKDHRDYGDDEATAVKLALTAINLATGQQA